MARRVFFSFHYQNDVWRANQICNCHMIEGTAAAGFQDASLWEETKRQGDAAIKGLIDRGLQGTTVTAVLIGSQTAQRQYVNYEMIRTIELGHGLLGIYIHGLKDRSGYTSVQGANPFGNLYWEKNGQRIYISSHYRTYDWVADRGYDNIAEWVEAAARQANL